MHGPRAAVPGVVPFRVATRLRPVVVGTGPQLPASAGDRQWTARRRLEQGPALPLPLPLRYTPSRHRGNAAGAARPRASSAARSSRLWTSVPHSALSRRSRGRTVPWPPAPPGGVPGGRRARKPVGRRRGACTRKQRSSRRSGSTPRPPAARRLDASECSGRPAHTAAHGSTGSTSMAPKPRAIRLVTRQRSNRFCRPA